jgi:NTE family protein
MTTAVVLGGGGSTGVAWEIGVLMGLAEAGLDVLGADAYIGTSAGSIVTTQLLAGPGIEALFAHARQPIDAAPTDLDFAAVSASWAVAAAGATSAEDARARIGRLALAAATMPPEQRRAEIAALLPVRDWSDDRQVVTAVSATTGAFHTFTARSEVDFVSAIGASCAVPGVWPPVEIDGEYFMDGAVRSPTNAGVAAGHAKVLVIAPALPALGGGVARELGRLGDGTVSAVIAADAGAVTAFGPNPLDVTAGPAAAIEGLRQGRDAAAHVRPLLV